MNTKQDTLTRLRKRAEAVLNGRAGIDGAKPEEFEETLHELSVYQAELEIQFEDLQHAYRLVEEAERQYADLFDFAPVGYVVTDANGVIVNANLTACAMLDVERGHIRNILFAEYLLPADQDIYHLHRRAVVNLGGSQICQVQIRRTNGEVFHAQLTTQQADQRTSTLRTVLTNVNALKQMEQAQQEALAHAKDISQLRGRLLTVLAHEFRTPLSVILSSAETLERYSDRLTDEKKSQRYRTIYNMVWYLNNMVQDIRSISVHEENDVPRLAAFDIVLFLSQVVNDMRMMAKPEQMLLLEIHAPHETEMVTWDQQLIRRVLMNLMNNALAYSQSDVQCRLNCEADTIQIQIEDHGIGIPLSDKPHIFEAFFRGSNTVEGTGVGIGLYMVKGAVVAHGGAIRCESSPGVGTTFTLELPREVTG
jgi:PAS domain S-box-containing protein